MKTSSEEWNYQTNMLYLEAFIEDFKEGTYEGPKRSILEDEKKMVTCFDYILTRVGKLHDTLPFTVTVVELIEHVMAESYQKHSDNHDKGVYSKGDWLYTTIVRCGDILIAVLEGYAEEYGIAWDFEIKEK